MNAEYAYIYLAHLAALLRHGAVSALRLEEPEEREKYVAAAETALAALEQTGVIVEGKMAQEGLDSLN